MKEYEGYLIDLDGTMYRGKESIPEAVQFVARLRKKDIPFLFVTNNSSKTPRQVAEHLNHLGMEAKEEEVFTTSMAAANYLYDHHPNTSIYVIGETGLMSALEERGLKLTDEDPEAVIIGIDRKITYEKLAKACLSVRKGAMFFSTNGDIALPTEKGLLPGNGAITSVVSISTQTEPIFIGKPHRIIMEQALKVLGSIKEKTLMVGDNYDTDILAGINIGMDTLLVHTGVTTREALKEKKSQPTHVLDTLEEWNI
ncbi:TIGR01457 family HAD-type hydrolase [Siminovitchia terrae]|uniref:TIGR01457 family HAD-type hydrolase n=1 Tax=Siminovitchia terrae TaxID=1914933 RepID=A0A429X654_SIMTE|nr:TIGR01457 family HAD-type hydrolase [Siminovitchia terrae]RST58918.1 TIGR01457 family HAD-type hydrolase [Siminovitchia terrae]